MVHCLDVVVVLGLTTPRSEQHKTEVHAGGHTQAYGTIGSIGSKRPKERDRIDRDKDHVETLTVIVAVAAVETQTGTEAEAATEEEAGPR